MIIIDPSIQMHMVCLWRYVLFSV